MPTHSLRDQPRRGNATLKVVASARMAAQNATGVQPPPAPAATLPRLRHIGHLTLLSQRHARTPMLRDQRPKTGHDPRITT